jgi:hypothetical protein
VSRVLNIPLCSPFASPRLTAGLVIRKLLVGNDIEDVCRVNAVDGQNGPEMVDGQMVQRLVFKPLACSAPEPYGDRAGHDPACHAASSKTTAGWRADRVFTDTDQRPRW